MQCGSKTKQYALDVVFIGQVLLSVELAEPCLCVYFQYLIGYVAAQSKCWWFGWPSVERLISGQQRYF